MLLAAEGGEPGDGERGNPTPRIGAACCPFEPRLGGNLAKSVSLSAWHMQPNFSGVFLLDKDGSFWLEIFCR